MTLTLTLTLWVGECGHTHSLGRLLSETVTTINMRPCQDYTHWENQITLSHVTPWFKPFAAVDIFQILREMSKPRKLYYTALVQHNLYINKNVFENVISINHSSNEKQAVQG